MNQVKQIREEIGFSQRMLALFLGVPRASISMAELNKRKLNSAVMLRLEGLLQLRPYLDGRFEDDTNDVIRTMTMKSIEKLERTKERLEFELQGYTRRLNALQAEHEQMHCVLLFIDYERRYAKDAPAHLKRHNKNYKKIMKAFIRSHPSVQLRLRLSMATHLKWIEQAEAEIAELRAVAGLDDQPGITT